MAKKKFSAVSTKQEENHSRTKNLTPRDLSPDNRMESLKTLNQLLLKETVEKREQVSSLQFRIDELSFDQFFLSDLERDVSRVVLSFSFAEEKLWFDRRAELQAESWELKERTMADRHRQHLERMEKDLQLLAVERTSALDNMNSFQLRLDSALDALAATEKKLGRVTGEKDEIKKALDLAVSERDLSCRELDLKRVVVGDLEVKVRGLEMAGTELRAYLDCVKVEREELEKQGRRTEEALRSLNEEKISAEGLLVEYRQLIEKMERETKEMVRSQQEEMEVLRVEKEVNAAKVSALEEECRCLAEIKQRLADQVSASKDAFDSLKREEEALCSKVAAMEKSNSVAAAELERLRVNIGLLEKEKKEKENSVELQMRESAQQLDDLRRRLEEIAKEKDEIERVKDEQEVESTELKKEMVQLHLLVSELQGMCKDHTETNTQLQADRDAVERDLDLQRKEACSLVLQVEELKKHIDGLLRELVQLKAAHDELVSANVEVKKNVELLREEKNSVERSLLTAEGKLEDMERKMRAAKTIYGRSLSLLKSTTEAMNGLERPQENGEANNNDGEEIRPIAEELQSIKMAFRRRVEKIEDMNREIEQLQSELANAQKRGGFWMWLYPATTTVFAAMSFAYAVRGR